MIRLTMNGTRTLLVLSLALFLVGTLPALAQGPVRADLPGGDPSELSGWLPVRLVCQDCTEDSSPALAALWRDEDGTQTRRTLRTLSWADGSFEWLRADGGSVPVEGRLLQDGSHGWSVTLPLDGQGAPFRLQAQLEGYTAERLAFWPARDGVDELAIDFRPVFAFFDEHPQWSTERTVECDLLVPKSTDQAVTFFAEGRPAAWLYSTADPEIWTFQFVRPGATLLDRVSVSVRASDEGEHYGFRLPLSGLLGGDAQGRLELGAHDGLDSDEGLPVAVRVGAAAVVNLADCPRVPVELAEAELENEGF
jgi:hypothetical protein